MGWWWRIGGAKHLKPYIERAHHTQKYQLRITNNSLAKLLHFKKKKSYEHLGKKNIYSIRKRKSDFF